MATVCSTLAVTQHDCILPLISFQVTSPSIILTYPPQPAEARNSVSTALNLVTLLLTSSDISPLLLLNTQCAGRLDWVIKILLLIRRRNEKVRVGFWKGRHRLL